MSGPLLYHYWRSSSSWRVRWALALKGIDYTPVAVDLLAGEQREGEHRSRNPLATVPVLFVGGHYLAESVAILEFLEETRPTPPLLPKEAHARAAARQLTQMIVADTQPLQNLAVLKHISKLSGSPEGAREWAVHYIERGFDGYEAQLGRLPAATYSVGETVTMADLCLVPQCYNARRQGLDLLRWPRIAAIEAACLKSEAAQRSHPDSFAPA